MKPEELRVALAAAGDDDEAVRRLVHACAAAMRSDADLDHFALADALWPLASHPSDKVRRALADACDAFPGPLFEAAHSSLLADPDHYVGTAARRAGERRAEWRKRSERSDATDHLTATLAAEITAEHGKGALRLARRLARREVEQYVERMGHEATKIDGAIDRALESLVAELAKSDPSLATLRARAAALGDRVLLQRTLLRRARDFARRVTPSFAPEKVASMVEEAREQLAHRLGPRAAALRFHADIPAALALHADRAAILQALQNLLQNAVEAYPATADALVVRVIARPLRQATEVELRIEDDGAGMSPAVQAALFVPFRSSKPGGTGVGLLLARKMIEDVHGGAIAVTSTLGIGTKVLLTLPARQAGVKGGA